jgi:maltooligosyltrehalose trehalohydrolase
VEVTVVDNKMLIVNRSVEGQRVSCFLNFSKDSLPIAGHLTDPALKICMDSADREWGGPGKENSDTVAPESFILFTNQNV